MNDYDPVIPWRQLRQGRRYPATHTEERTLRDELTYVPPPPGYGPQDEELIFAPQDGEEE